MKKILKYISLILLLILITTGCSNNSTSEINIIYTSDVHCGVNDNVTYAGVAELKNKLKESNKYVTLVDCGDALQGDYIGSVSKGKYITDIMNKVGYDLFTLGNHEFDYGMDVLSERISEFNGSVLSCNIKYTGKNENKLSNVIPYKILKYGNTKVGFVGVTTPFSITDSTPANFMENNEYVYNFTNNTKEEFYSCVQSNVDEVKKKGAKYVILLAHLGQGEEYGDFSSVALCENTKNIDVILDGHAHKDIECEYHKNIEGKNIPLSETGYKLSNMGLLTIKKDGKFEFNLTSKDDAIADIKIKDYIQELTTLADELGNKIVCNSNKELKITDENGIRLVRSRETLIGNLIADAYCKAGETDIAFVNGGGIRADLKEGDISYKDIQAIHPFGNTICVMNVRGSAILDYLEFVTRFTEDEYVKDGKANGESGAFANVSGIKFKINTAIESTVILDSNNMFSGVTGNRRVHDVLILDNGEYKSLDLNKTYKVASNNYVLLNSGDGANMFANTGELVKKDVMLDYEAVINYIVDELNGDIKTKYSSLEGRITIE